MLIGSSTSAGVLLSTRVSSRLAHWLPALQPRAANLATVVDVRGIGQGQAKGLVDQAVQVLQHAVAVQEGMVAACAI